MFFVCPVGVCMFMQEMLCQKLYFLEKLRVCGACSSVHVQRVLMLGFIDMFNT